MNLSWQKLFRVSALELHADFYGRLCVHMEFNSAWVDFLASDPCMNRVLLDRKDEYASRLHRRYVQLAAERKESIGFLSNGCNMNKGKGIMDMFTRDTWTKAWNLSWTGYLLGTLYDIHKKKQ